LSDLPIEALFMDFYGTFCAGDRLAVETACVRIVEAFDLPITPPQFAIRWGEVFFKTIENSNHDRFRTLHECESVSLRKTLNEFVGQIDPEPFVTPLKEYWRNPPLHDDAVGLLEQIDVPVCCVSNADREDIDCALGLHGLRFDAVITSQCARCYKPEAKIFRQAADLLGVDLARVTHVGDSLHSDVGGAAQLGITSIWISREQRIYDIGTCQPDYTIRSLQELPAVLEKLNRK